MKKLLILLLGLVIMLSGCGPKVDEETKELNRIIDRFIEVYADDYIKLGDAPVLHENVIAAIKALDDYGMDISLNDYLSKEEVKEYYDELDYTSIAVAYKAIVISKAFEVTHEKATTYLESLTEVDVDIWSYTYGIIALRLANVNSALENALLGKINIIREEDFRDADYAGYALIASSGKTLDRAPLYTLINDNLTETGVNFYGSANSAATASVILGLIADGKNPISEEYTTNGVNLVDALLGFEVDGAFKNTFEESEVDLGFSTPQAFSAIVSYKLFKEGKSANILLP